MAGYESDEFEKMSDDESPEKAPKSSTAAATNFVSAVAQQQALSGSGGFKVQGNESPTSMSAFAVSLANTGQSSTLRPALNAFNFESLEPGRLSHQNSTGNLLANPNSGTFASSANATPPATTGNKDVLSPNAVDPGYVAPTPAMDSAEEAIAKVLEGKIWRKQYDANQKKFYYYHTVTRQTTWDLAKELGFGAPAAVKSPLASEGSKAPMVTSLLNTQSTPFSGHRDSSESASATTSSALPPDPLLIRGGPGYRYSGFVTGGGFGDSNSNTSNRQSFNGPYGRGDSAEVSGGGGAFGDYDGFVAFGKGGTPSASASQSATPRRIAADMAMNAPLQQKSITLIGIGGGHELSSNTPIPNTNAATLRHSLHSVPSITLKDTDGANATAAGFGEASMEDPAAAIALLAPANGAQPERGTEPKATANAANPKAKDSDEESSAFSTLSGVAAKAAAEAKAKADAQLAVEKAKLEAQRHQQAKDAAEAMAKMAALRGGIATPPPLTSLGASGVTAGSQLVSPLAGTLGPNGQFHPSGAATAPPGIPLIAGSSVPPLMPLSGLGLNSPNFAIMNAASPLLPLSTPGAQFPSNALASPGLNARSPVLLGGTAAGSPNLQQQVQYQQHLQQQQQQAAAGTAQKTELLQTAEALEKLVKAFVVLKQGDNSITGPHPSSAMKRAADAAYSDATEYDTLLRAARYKHVAELGSQQQQLLTSHMVPTRGRYLMDSQQQKVLTTVPSQPQMPSDMGPLAALTFAERCNEAAAVDDTTRHLEDEILNTVIAMMTADEGKAMWLHAGGKQQKQPMSSLAAADAAKQQARAQQRSKKETLIDVVSIDQYRSYTNEGGSYGRGPLSNHSGILSSGNGRPNTIPSASRFHVDAFDSLTGAFVPGADTPLATTPSNTPTPLGNLLEENLEKYLLKHVQPVRGRGVLPASAMLPNGEVMPVITPHLARMILLDLLRITIDVSITRFSNVTKSTLPVNGRDPIIVVYEGPLGKAVASGGNHSSFSPARFLIEACKRTVQSLPFELLALDSSKDGSSSELKKPRFRLEHWVTKPHVYSIIHALQWSLRKLERRSNDPYADFFADTALDRTMAPSSSSATAAKEVHVSELDGEWSRVYASELPFFSLAPAQFLSTAKRSGNEMAEDHLGDDTPSIDPLPGDSAQTERELMQVLQGQVPDTKNPAGKRDKSQAFPSGPGTGPLHTRDYFGLDADHLEVMAFAASSIGLDVFRSIAGTDKPEAAKPLTDVTNIPAAASIATATKPADTAPHQREPPALPLAMKQEIATQCTVACIEELLADPKILESIKRRATNKANALVEERDKKWRERYESGQKALKSGADFVELEAKRRRDEVAAAEKRIGLMVDRMKEEINRQM